MLVVSARRGCSRLVFQRYYRANIRHLHVLCHTSTAGPLLPFGHRRLHRRASRITIKVPAVVAIAATLQQKRIDIATTTTSATSTSTTTQRHRCHHSSNSTSVTNSVCTTATSAAVLTRDLWTANTTTMTTTNASSSGVDAGITTHAAAALTGPAKATTSILGGGDGIAFSATHIRDAAVDGLNDHLRPPTMSGHVWTVPKDAFTAMQQPISDLPPMHNSSEEQRAKISNSGTSNHGEQAPHQHQHQQQQQQQQQRAKALTKLLREPASLLRRGFVVSFPTETVYGLGANAFCTDAVATVFRAKGRPADNPLIVHVASRQQFRALVAQPIPRIVETLCDRFWPGPLSIVLPVRQHTSLQQSQDTLSHLVTADLPTVAVRMPAHPVALALIAAAGVPIAAPSANLSGKPSPTDGSHVMHDLGASIAGVVDAGPTGVGLESTVVDCTAFMDTTQQNGLGEDGASVHSSETTDLVVLRHGGVTVEQLREAVGNSVRVVVDSHAEAMLDFPTVAENVDGRDAVKATQEGSATIAVKSRENGSGPLRPRAPGMKYVHYSPKAPVFVACSPEVRRALVAKVWVKDGDGDGSKRRVGVLTTADRVDGVRSECRTDTTHQHGDAKAEFAQNLIVLACGRSVDDPASIARELYGALREFDAIGVDLIIADSFDCAGIGSAIMNRLCKASGRPVLRSASDLPDTW